MSHRNIVRITARRGVAALAVAALMPLAAAGVSAAAATAGAGPDTAGTISTIAGGVGGPAMGTSLALPNPGGVTFGNGKLYIADGGSVREVNPATGYLTTPAGTGTEGPTGANGSSAARAYLGTRTVAVDHSGNLVIGNAQRHDNKVRVVPSVSGTYYGQAMKAGHIYTVAGDGETGSGGDGGPATKAELTGVSGVAIDAAGNLVISAGARVRVVAARTGTFYGQSMTAGDIYHVAGGGTVGKVGDGLPATSVKLRGVYQIMADPAGNLLFAEDGRIRVVAENTGSYYGQSMTSGDIYTVAGGGKDSPPSGELATTATLAPESVSEDASGNLVIADTGGAYICVVAESTGMFYGQPMTAGHIYAIAGTGLAGFSGDGGPAKSAQIREPLQATVDPAGNVVFTDTENARIRVIAESDGTFYGKPMTTGDIYSIVGNGKLYSGNGEVATRAILHLTASLQEGDVQTKTGVAQEPNGNVVFADTGSPEVRMIAESTGTFFGQAMKAGHIYDVAGNGRQRGPVDNGAPATSVAVPEPTDVAVDTNGNLLVPEGDSNLLRVIAATAGTFYGQSMTTGHIYTIAGGGRSLGDGGPATSARLCEPEGVGLDARGNVLIADSCENRIRVIAESTGSFYGQSMKAGDIYTVAGDGQEGSAGDGGPAAGAQLYFPESVTVDAHGNLVIGDTDNDLIRVVAAQSGTFYGQAMTADDIYTVAGGGTNGPGNGGPALDAALPYPRSVAVDANGNLVLVNPGFHEIQVVAAQSGPFYGQAMTAGDIYGVAGDGTMGFAGDGGPATSAELAIPSGVAVESDGNLLISDTFNQRIRLVTG